MRHPFGYLVKKMQYAISVGTRRDAAKDAVKELYRLSHHPLPGGKCADKLILRDGSGKSPFLLFLIENSADLVSGSISFNNALQGDVWPDGPNNVDEPI